MFIQIGSQTWASLSFVPPILAKVRIPPRAAARAHFLVINYLRCWTVLSEFQYEVAYNPSTFFLNWKQVQQEKPLRMNSNTSKCMYSKSLNQNCREIF